MIQPRSLIIIGFFLVLTGAVLPFLMVIRLVPSTYLLNFISYGASIGGLFLGIIGAANYVRSHENRHDRH